MSGKAPKVVMPDELPPVISDALTKALIGEEWQTEAIVRVLEERPELTRLFEIVRGTLGNEQVQTRITLDQAAALVQRSKRTLQKYKGRGLPIPTVKGGGGRPHEWAYSIIRPWLEKQFGRTLPERFPAPFRAGAGRN